MRNYLHHKSIKIFLTALFFAVGIGAFALVASAAVTYKYVVPTTYTRTTLPPLLKSQKDKDDFAAFTANFYRDMVVDKVNNSFGTGGADSAVYTRTVSYGNAWNTEKKALTEWEMFEATKIWVAATTVHDPEGGPDTIIAEHYGWNENIRPNRSTPYGIQNPNPYTSLSAAQAGEAPAYNDLVAADETYINALNRVAHDAIVEELNRIKEDRLRVANELATKEYNECMANATGVTYKDTPPTAPIVYTDGLSPAPAKRTLGEEKLACDKEKAAALAEAGAAGDALGAGVKASSTVETIGGTSTSTPGTSSTGGSLTLTDEQKAQALALTANQEMASPKEMELLASLKAGCYKINPLSMNCLAQIPYYFIYTPASWLLIIAGYMFDASLSLSIDKEFVNQDFVKESWTVIRDFSNMLFIFILLYTGIQTILGLGDWRKTVLHIVIIALLINFSLFFTKVVIDAGNILAVGVYQSMGATKTAGTGMLTSGSIPERNLSETLVASFSPQKFLEKTGKVNEWNALIVFLIAAAVNAVAAYVLFKVALVFIGRLLAFWVLMILSPFAFISFTLKGDANIFGWYTSTLISQAFVAPVFLFLLYLVMTVISAGGGIMSAFAK